MSAWQLTPSRSLGSLSHWPSMFKFHPSNRPHKWAFVDRRFAWVALTAKWSAKLNKGRRAEVLQGWWGGKVCLLHRVIMKLAGHHWPQCDHKNHNPLDCRWGNLRPADHAQNRANCPRRRDNTTGYSGVYTHKLGWTAAVGHKGRMVYLGLFTNKREAARVRDVAATKYHGAFAVLNFPKR